MKRLRAPLLRARARAALRLLHRRERGATAVMVALTLPVLLGFAGLAVDTGLLYAQQAKIQKSADLAALSGAQVLPEQPGNAPVIANEVFQQNYGSLTPVKNINLFSSPAGADTGIKVHYEQTVPLFFMPVLGISNGTVVGKAEAQSRAMSRPAELIPIGIPHTTSLNHGTEMALYGDLDATYAPGNFGLINLQGSSTTDELIEKWIRDGYTSADGPVPAVGTSLTTITGVKAGPVSRAIDARYADGRTLVICPVMDYTNVKGSTGKAPVKGFALFEITRKTVITGEGNTEKVQVWGRFLRKLNAPGDYDASATHYGVKKVVLIK